MKNEAAPRRRIHVGPKVVTLEPALVLWGERMGHPITNALVAKAMRQYLKTLERTRAHKKLLRSTAEGREYINRKNRESRAKLRRELGSFDEELGAVALGFLSTRLNTEAF